MDETIKKVLVGGSIIAGVGVIIGIGLAYWYYLLGIGVAGFLVYKYIAKQKDERNRV